MNILKQIEIIFRQLKKENDEHAEHDENETNNTTKN